MARNGVRCPSCGARTKTEERPYEIDYKGRKGRVRVVADWCDSCGDGVLEGEALEKIEKARFNLRAKVEHVMSPADVRLARLALHLTQARASEILGGGPHAFQKYESGEQAVSVPMTNLLKLLIKDPARLQELIEDTSPKGQPVERQRASKR
jgi:HTH-type transcriptional regulator/antitoxin MqsA